MELDKNPNPKDIKKAYAIPKSKKDKANKFGKKLKDWTLSTKDKEKINKFK